MCGLQIVSCGIIIPSSAACGRTDNRLTNSVHLESFDMGTLLFKAKDCVYCKVNGEAKGK